MPQLATAVFLRTIRLIARFTRLVLFVVGFGLRFGLGAGCLGRVVSFVAVGFLAGTAVFLVVGRALVTSLVFFVWGLLLPLFIGGLLLFIGLLFGVGLRLVPGLLFLGVVTIGLSIIGA